MNKLIWIGCSIGMILSHCFAHLLFENGSPVTAGFLHAIGIFLAFGLGVFATVTIANEAR